MASLPFGKYVSRISISDPEQLVADMVEHGYVLEADHLLIGVYLRDGYYVSDESIYAYVCDRFGIGRRDLYDLDVSEIINALTLAKVALIDRIFYDRTEEVRRYVNDRDNWLTIPADSKYLRLHNNPWTPNPGPIECVAKYPMQILRVDDYTWGQIKPFFTRQEPFQHYLFHHGVGSEQDGVYTVLLS